MCRRRGRPGRRIRHVRPVHRVRELDPARQAPDCHTNLPDLALGPRHDRHRGPDDGAGLADDRRVRPDNGPGDSSGAALLISDDSGRGPGELDDVQVHVQAPVPAHGAGRHRVRRTLRPRHPRAVFRWRHATAAGERRFDRPRLHELAARHGRRPEQHAPAATRLLEPDHPHPDPHRRHRVDRPGHGRKLRRQIRLRTAGRERGPRLQAHRLRTDRRRLRLRVGARQDRDPDRHLRVDQLELPPSYRRRGPNRLRPDQHPARRDADLAEARRHTRRRRHSRPSRRVRPGNAATDAASQAPPQGALPRGAATLARRGPTARAPPGLAANGLLDARQAHPAPAAVPDPDPTPDSAHGPAATRPPDGPRPDAATDSRSHSHSRHGRSRVVRASRVDRPRGPEVRTSLRVRPHPPRPRSNPRRSSLRPRAGRGRGSGSTPHPASRRTRPRSRARARVGHAHGCSSHPTSLRAGSH